MPDTVMVTAPHPDDEVLGCGGVLALHARSGTPVTIVIVCEGESLRYGPSGVGQDAHILRAAEKLGGASVHHLRFPDQALDVANGILSEGCRLELKESLGSRTRHGGRIESRFSAGNRGEQCPR